MHVKKTNIKKDFFIIKKVVESFSDYIVNRKAIRQNLIEYKKIDNNSKICAVVKADGYGIGAENVVDAIDDMTDFYAVACFKEALSLRNLTEKPILILNFVEPEVLNECAQKNISISVSNFKQVMEIEKFCDKNIKIHLAINTGMNRIGFSQLSEFEKTLEYLKSQNKILIEGIFTHIYNASNRNDTKKQICIFMQYINLLSKYFDSAKIIKHASASLSAVRYPEYRFDMVRLGILLYGDIDNKILTLNNALKIKTTITNVYKIEKGESVGYGKNFVAKKQMKIATVPLGYADGIFRQYAKTGEVFVKGKRCKILGNICMDMFMIDITNKKIKIGDNVEILGKNISLSEVAKKSLTISYEILTNIKKRRFNVKII